MSHDPSRPTTKGKIMSEQNTSEPIHINYEAATETDVSALSLSRGDKVVDVLHGDTADCIVAALRGLQGKVDAAENYINAMESMQVVAPESEIVIPD